MYQAPRGTSDILPEEQPYWRYIERAVEEIAGLYGYRRIDTPIFESTALFSRSAGEYTDIVQKEMYTFEDRGGNSLTLKPEGTPPVCRAYIQHGMQNLPQPVKLYYLSPIFRYDRPQAGRYRQHYQFGCENIGDGDPAVDAEVIEMAWRFFMSLGMGALSLQLNSIGCRECRPAYLSALTDYYSRFAGQLCVDCRTRLEKNPLRLLDCKQASCRDIAGGAPPQTSHLCPACAGHFSTLRHYLDLLSIPYRLNHRLVRGLDYYTRTVFEIQPEVEGGQSTLGGGGRYDYLIEELGGKPTPAIGFAAGIERIILNIKKQEVEVPTPPPPRVFIACIGDRAREESIRLADRLRRAGISAVTAAGGKSLKAQLRQANSLGARSTVIIGEEEIAAGRVIIRDMVDASQRTVPSSDLVSFLNGQG